MTGSQEVRGFESHRLHRKVQVSGLIGEEIPRQESAGGAGNEVTVAAPAERPSHVLDRPDVTYEAQRGAWEIG
jgi:hypothetical protein